MLGSGSFGSVPKCVQSEQRKFQIEIDGNPDCFLRFQCPDLIDHARSSVARLLGASVEDIVLVTNATMGVNIVLRNLVPTWDANSAVVYFSTTYGACQKTILSTIECSPNVKAVAIACQYPISDSALLSQFHETLDKLESEGLKVRLALFDTIVALPGVRMPFEALVSACKERNIMSLIDAAHGVGHIQLDMSVLDPDFLVSNAHKWLYVPRACAVFYVPKRNQALMRTSLPTSHGFKPKSPSVPNPLPPSTKSDFVINFEWTGTIDPTAFLCVPAALQFREACGGEAKIMAYNARLACEGSRVVADYLGTEVMDNYEGTLTKDLAMANVRLPLCLASSSVSPSAEKREKDMQVRLPREMSPQALVHWMHARIIEKHNSFVQLFFYNGSIWVRLSAQIYLELDDFTWVAHVLQDICQLVSTCKGFES